MNTNKHIVLLWWLVIGNCIGSPIQFTSKDEHPWISEMAPCDIFNSHADLGDLFAENERLVPAAAFPKRTRPDCGELDALFRETVFSKATED